MSITGYHIAEAGANPLSQLAFTLANGFTYVESYLARGLDIDDFAPNLSFFFSNGMDPEYAVLGRVARRIWAVAMRDRYGANERSQKLKYHVQTSGRSLHAQEMDFNDIRTTLQALIALYDNANSLHTNAYDEAVTTPTAESVRRALAIQLIINREWGLSMNENPNQGSFVIEQLTDLVEEAVLAELERISERGGVLGAMETGYQRGRIQDESMLYEQRKHDGTLPLIGVNTFLDPERPRRTQPPRHRAAAPHRRGEAEPDHPPARLPGAPRRRAPRHARSPPRRRPRRRQPLRRPHGRRARLHPRRDHRHPLRGRRPLPPQRLGTPEPPASVCASDRIAVLSAHEAVVGGVIGCGGVQSKGGHGRRADEPGLHRHEPGRGGRRRSRTPRALAGRAARRTAAGRVRRAAASNPASGWCSPTSTAPGWCVTSGSRCPRRGPSACGR